MKFKTILILSFLISSQLFSRSLTNDKNIIYGHPLLSFNYSLNNTALDWKTRFGIFNSIGIDVGYKTKQNWIYLVEGNFIFGNQYKETKILDNLKDSYGNITDDQGNIATVPIFTRGFSISYISGKLIPITANKNSGILLKLGVGFLSYKYRIETNSENVPPLEGNYIKGYDRLTQGLLLSEFIGYQHVSNKNLYNFYLGFYLQQGFTQNKRKVFFDQPDLIISNKIRNDFSYGIRIGWNIPFFNDKPKEFYYY